MPRPNILFDAVEPKIKVDQEKLEKGLARLAHEDSTFRVRNDQTNSQTIISALGELQLDNILNRLIHENKVEATFGGPQVIYCETIRQDANAEGKYFRHLDLKVLLYDGSYHDADSNEMAFKIAGSMAFKEAARKAKPVLLEPMMAVEVTAPHDSMGTVISDLNSRRGRIEGIELLEGVLAIRATVPLSTMLGYADGLGDST